MPVQSCGQCRWCTGGEPSHCERVDLLGVGGAASAFAELVRVDARHSVELPADTADLAASVEPLAVGLHAATAGGITPGTTTG